MAPTNGYCSVAELKARIWPSGTTDTTDDSIFDQVITAVSRLIDDECQRRFYAASETRYYTPEWPDLLMVDDLLSVTTLKTDADGDRVYESAWATTDYDLEPYNAQLESQPRPYTQIVTAPNGLYTFPVGRKRGVQLAGSFGFASATPPKIKEACLLQSARIYKRKDAVFGVTGSAEMGQLIVIPKLDPDVVLMLRSFKKGLGQIGAV
jgi:hypothetical protein